MITLRVEPSTNKYHSCLACHDSNEDRRYYQITIGSTQLELCEVCAMLLTYDLSSTISNQKGFN